MATLPLNPYATFLDRRDPLPILAETPEQLRSLAQKLGPAGLERSLAPGKWTARRILCHLADCEIVFSFRLRQTLASNHHTIQPFDQDGWAAFDSAFSAAAALEVFSSVRDWNIALTGSLSPENFSKPVTHPERGTMAFKTILETMAGHDLNHIQQLEKIARENSAG